MMRFQPVPTFADGSAAYSHKPKREVETIWQFDQKMKGMQCRGKSRAPLV